MQKFINWLRSLFAQPGNRPVSNRTLESVTAEEIRMERIKVEQTEARISREIEQLEKQKEEFFAKGVGCGSDRQKLQYARKVRELANNCVPVLRSDDFVSAGMFKLSSLV